jgi:hypothetical protein
MRNAVGAWVVAVLWVGTAGASVTIETFDRPMVERSLAERRSQPHSGGLFDAQVKANIPLAGQWFVPFYRADKVGDGESTYFAVRNEGPLAATVVAEFFDVFFEPQTTESYELESREVRTVAVKHVAGLPVDPDGFTRGLLRLFSVASISLDTFQLDTENAFAVGGVGFVEGDFCTRWNARFLRFGPSGGTTLSMLINGPRGTQSSDPTTLVLDVYRESGDFVISFGIRTDQWSLELPLHDLLPSGVNFGVVELGINAAFTPSGLVQVRHEALGEFSVGHVAMCAD